jgi:hypothetical protein
LATRAKCHTCKKTFTPTFETGVKPESALYLDAAASAAPLSAEGVSPPPAELPQRSAPPPRPHSPAPVFTLTTPPPPSVGVAMATPPPAAVDLQERPEPVAPTPLSEPPPPTMDPANRIRQRGVTVERRSDRLRPYEVALAAGLVVAIVGVLGVLWYENHSTSNNAAVAEGEPADETKAPEPVVLDETQLAPKPWPKQLIGVWDLRSDDGRTGQLILRPDGTLIATSVAGSSPLADYEGHWYLVKEDGNQFILEFGSERYSLDGYRVKLLLTNANAFTLVETIKGGVSIREVHRFVRTGPAPTASSASREKKSRP